MPRSNKIQKQDRKLTTVEFGTENMNFDDPENITGIWGIDPKAFEKFEKRSSERAHEMMDKGELSSKTAIKMFIDVADEVGVPKSYAVYVAGQMDGQNRNPLSGLFG